MQQETVLREILSEIKQKKISRMDDFNRIKLKIAEKHSLEKLPRNSEIIAVATDDEKSLFSHILTRKPARSMSGVTVVAVMTKPKGCIAKCIYCPGSLVPGKLTPKSYTGLEPSTMRSMRHNFDPFKVIQNRLRQYAEINKSVQKIELILQGGTFCALPYSHQKYFIKRCYDGIVNKKTGTLNEAKFLSESSKTRIVGLTIETRPDWCKKKDINRMLNFGATRVELGVQNADNEIYRKTARGHSVQDVVESTQLLKDSCFKVLYHIMPGLPGSSPEKDLANFRMLFENQDFMPDMLKIYPCLVIPGTPLYNLWKQGKFEPLSSGQAAELIAEMKKFIPKYVRVMRIQRDIPAQLISGGVQKSNLRELVQKELERKGAECKCIRCREAALKSYKKNIPVSPEKAELQRLEYNASNGKEIFLSMEDKENDALFGFCRLRIPFAPFRKEITLDSALIRELHVYSPVLELGQRNESAVQHRGFGKQLMLEAEKIAKEEFSCKKMAVIAGTGVREYYKRFFGYENDGCYVSKKMG